MSKLVIAWCLFGTLGGNSSKVDPAATQSIEQALEMWDIDRASAAVDRLLAGSPSLAEVRLLAARVRFHEGRYRDAMTLLQEASRLSPTGETAATAASMLEFVRPLEELDRRFVVVESEHFKVHFVDGPDRVLAARAIETLEGSVRVLGEEFGIYPTSKVRVEIFPDAESFQLASTLSKTEIETSGTIALCKFNRLMMMSPRLVLRGFTWCDTLCHEYVHYVLWKRNGPTIPIWLHEGIAKYEESRWSGAKPTELSVFLKQVLKSAVVSGEFVTLDEMHPSFAKLDSPKKVALASAEVLSLIHHVMDRGGKELLGKMLDALRDGGDWRQMFEVALNQPFDDFWSQWREAVKVELADVEGLPEFDKLVEIRDPTLAQKPDEPDAEAGGPNRFARLGDLLRGRGLDPAATIEYERAAADPAVVSVHLLNRLAATYRRAGDVGQAIRGYERSLAIDPEYAPTLTQLGLLSRERGDERETVGYLERAARINPFDPRIHQVLAEVYGFLGRRTEQNRAEQELLILRAR